jgi:hypothetical protein
MEQSSSCGAKSLPIPQEISSHVYRDIGFITVFIIARQYVQETTYETFHYGRITICSSGLQ